MTAWRPGADHAEPVGETGRGGFDGIELLGGGILVSSQSDSCVQLNSNGRTHRLIPLPAGPADIAVDTKRSRVAAPMVDLGRVEIWELPPGSH